MKKLLGDILIEKGYIKSGDLNRALVYQMKKIVGEGPLPSEDATEAFILEVARTKYNHRDEFLLGRILTELRLLPEMTLQEALEIQKRSELEKPRGKLDALRRISLRMNSSYNLIDLLHQLLVFAAQLVEADSISLIVHDRARDSLVILMPTGPGADRVREQEIPRASGIAGWVYESSRSWISNDVATDPKFYPGIDEASGYRTRQVLCVPLTVKDRKLGAIEAINKNGPEAGFSQADLFLLEMLSAQAAVAIANTRLTLALSRTEEEMALRVPMAARNEGIRVAAQLSDSFLHQLEKSFVPLRGYADRLKEAVQDPRAEKYSAYIDAEMTRLIRNTGNAVRFFKNECLLRTRSLELGQLLRELESRTWVDCRLSGIAFRASVAPDLRLSADHDLLLYALEKLFENSREAMPDGGTFSVECDLSDEDHVALAVRDTGKGFAPGARDRLFEPFSATDKPHAAGLGLAIARRIVEAHGGSITAGNREGAPGAEVIISLPLER